ncbi:hypothetical protein K9M48_04125 [Candidatus Gracilibacteria bacterium]|nr:hypothetical protein [Candidatus Gracilibacteria bacterium]
MSYDPKLLALLDIVIDNYINKGEPVGSKFLHTLEDIEYAPSTLRKYLNILEKSGMVYQPYNSSGRVPTIQGLKIYIESYIQTQEEQKEKEVIDARSGMKYLVENIGSLADGVVVGFLKNDEYYYLGMNNLLRDDLVDEYETTRNIIKFIENKRIVKFLDKKIIKNGHIYYTFVEDGDSVISVLYAKISIKDYDGILSIIGPTRVNYKQNVSIFRKVLQSLK